jgi:integrase
MLTKPQLDRARPKSTRYVLWDGKLAGFGVRVQPTGRKSFILSYRLRGTRRAITATIGTYGKITLEQAREKARKLAATIELDGDPGAVRKARAKAEAEDVLTVRLLVDRYLDAFESGRIASKRLQGRTVSPGYRNNTLRYLDRFASLYGHLAAVDVTGDRVERLLHDYVGHAATQWNLHGTIGRLYRWARRQGLVPVDPSAAIEIGKAAARERSLSLAELSAIWHAADALDPRHRDAVRLLMATGQRRGEVDGMRWSEIDLVQALWTLPAGRTKARRQHIIPLPALAVALLKARQKACESGAKNDDRVLPVCLNWDRAKQALDRDSQVRGWVMHDFRRSFVTILAERGINIAVLDSMLNHAASATRGGVIGVYQKATLMEPMKHATKLWNRLLDNALAGENKIVQLRIKHAH